MSSLESGSNGISFRDLRERITPKSIVVKKYTIEEIEVVIAKEETTYSVIVDGQLLSADFDDQMEAEEAATSFLTLLGEENLDEKKWTAKERKKRLEMIRKAVERINAKGVASAQKAKRDALAMIKNSDMFDEEIGEQEKT